MTCCLVNIILPSTDIHARNCKTVTMDECKDCGETVTHKNEAPVMSLMDSNETLCKECLELRLVEDGDDIDTILAEFCG